MLSLGMPTLVENGTLEENIALCRALGLSFIELNMNFPEYQIDQLEDADRFVRLADEAGIAYTIHLDENLDPADFNPLVRAAYWETMQRTILAAKRFAALGERRGDLSRPVILNMHMNHGIHMTLPDRKVQMYERDFETYMAAFRAFTGRCEEWIGDADVKIAIENTNGFREYEKQAVEYMLRSGCFVLNWDIGHSRATGEADTPFILAHKDKLKHFHIHDAAECPPRDHLALGDGEIDLMQRLRLAKACGARCVLETKTIAALKKSVEWIREKGDLA